MDSNKKCSNKVAVGKVVEKGEGPICGVCSAPASHKKYYGGVTCVNCRMFFRRSVNRTYDCVRSTDDCKIDPKLRKFCKKCRFRRCIENGMDPKRVKSDQKKDMNDDVIEVIDDNEPPPNSLQSNIPLNLNTPQDLHKNSNAQQCLSTSVIVTNPLGFNFASNSSIYLIPSPIDDSSSTSALASTNSTADLISNSSIYLFPSPIEDSSSVTSAQSPFTTSAQSPFTSSSFSPYGTTSSYLISPSPMSTSSSTSVEEIQRGVDDEEILEPSIQDYVLDDSDGERAISSLIRSDNIPTQTTQCQLFKKSTEPIEISLSKLSLDEEFLIHEIVERKNMFGEWYYLYIMRYHTDWYQKFYKNDMSICDVSIYNEQFFKALFEMDNFMVPEHFGIFRREFLVSLSKFTVDAFNFFDAAIFLSNDRVSTIIEQDMAPNISPTSTDIVAKFSACMNGFGQLPPRKAEDFSMFKSPWCKSQEDEIFFETTFEELGQIGLADDKVKSMINLIIIFTQPKDSPFGKLRNIKRLKKSLSLLLYRYLKSVCSSSSMANDLCEKIVGLVNNLERCVYIYYNCRLK